MGVNDLSCDACIVLLALCMRCIGSVYDLGMMRECVCTVCGLLSYGLEFVCIGVYELCTMCACVAYGVFVLCGWL